MATIRNHPDAKRMIDAYIANSAPFAQPICRRVRTTILRTQPEIVKETRQSRIERAVKLIAKGELLS